MRPWVEHLQPKPLGDAPLVAVVGVRIMRAGINLVVNGHHGHANGLHGHVDAPARSCEWALTIRSMALTVMRTVLTVTLMRLAVMRVGIDRVVNGSHGHASRPASWSMGISLTREAFAFPLGHPTQRDPMLMTHVRITKAPSRHPRLRVMWNDPRGERASVAAGFVLWRSPLGSSTANHALPAVVERKMSISPIGHKITTRFHSTSK